MKRKTRATPAGIPRSKSRQTRAYRKNIASLWRNLCGVRYSQRDYDMIARLHRITKEFQELYINHAFCVPAALIDEQPRVTASEIRMLCERTPKHNP